MKPAPFEYHRPETLAEALDLLARHGDEARPLAGGQSLIPTMNFRLAQPEVLVDLNGVSALGHLEATEAGGLNIGAMTRQRAVERSALVAERAPLLHETMPFIAHPQIRTRGTVGGSLAHADPRSELPAVAVALEARFRLQGSASDRWIDATDFYRGLFVTALAEGELLTEVAFPAMEPGAGHAFVEISRRHGDYALVGAAAVVTLDGAGRCRTVRVVLLSAGDRPVLGSSCMAVLTGRDPTPAAISAAAAAVQGDVDPMEDVHGSPEYRRHVSAVVTRRALAEAVRRAGSETDA